MPTMKIHFSEEPTRYGQNRAVVRRVQTGFVRLASDILWEKEFPKSIEAFELPPGDYLFQWWAKGALSVVHRFTAALTDVHLEVRIQKDPVYGEISEDEVFETRIQQALRGKQQ